MQFMGRKQLDCNNFITINDSLVMRLRLIYLQANCTLKTLDLSWNGFASVGALYLADALKANNTLLELDIR